MNVQFFDPTSITLDHAGRIAFSSTILDEILSRNERILIELANANNCSACRNTNCTNDADCQKTDNLGCTNNHECGTVAPPQS